MRSASFFFKFLGLLFATTTAVATKETAATFTATTDD